MTISQRVYTYRLDAFQHHVAQYLALEINTLGHAPKQEPFVPAMVTLDDKGVLTCVNVPTSPVSSKQKHSSHPHNSRVQINLHKHQWTLVHHEFRTHSETFYSLCLLRRKTDSGFFKSLKRLSDHSPDASAASTTSSSNSTVYGSSYSSCSSMLTSSSPSATTASVWPLPRSGSRSSSLAHSCPGPSSLQDGLTLLMSDPSQLVAIPLIFSRETDCNWWKEAICAQGDIYVFSTRWMLPIAFPSIDHNGTSYKHSLFDDICHVSWFLPREPCSSPRTSSKYHSSRTCATKNCKPIEKHMIKIEGIS